MRLINFVKRAAAACTVLALVTGVALGQDGQPTPLAPQPKDSELSPGIGVVYYNSFVRHVDELRRWMEYKEGEPGEPVRMLDYSGGNEPVLTSPYSKGVGAHLSGAINFKEPGTYTFTALSNDGFELHIGGVLIVADPDVHYDRWSEIVSVEIAEPGWYDLEIFYFQRKGTAALELYWRPPWDKGDGDMAFVPAEVFAHFPRGRQS